MSVYNPTYIVAQQPNFYGGKQEDYLKRANLAIDQAAAKIRRAKSEGGDLVKLFYEIIDDFSRARSQIAHDHGTPDAIDFGKRRDRARANGLFLLMLDGLYESYRKPILTLLIDRVQTMVIRETSVRETSVREISVRFKKKECIYEEDLNHTSRLDIEILANSDINRGDSDLFLSLPLDVQQAWKEADKFPKGTEPDEVLKKLKEVLKKFKGEDPKLYQILFNRMIMQTFLQIEGKTKESWNSIWIHATARTEIKGKLYALTRYLCRIDLNDAWVLLSTKQAHDLLKMMKSQAKVMLIHQDVHLIEDTLGECALSFKDAVIWEKGKESEKELKDRMAWLQFLVAHNIRDIRGTGSGDEWIDYAIYKGLRVPISKDANSMIDLEALINPFFYDFRRRYHQIVKFLTK